jgi:hypothetical protein
MITMDRLLQILDDWKQYMKADNHKLGYPSKSLGMSSGGESTSDEFEHMLSAMDLANVRIIDAIIHDLIPEQQKALYARYLGAKKQTLYEYHLQNAMDNLLTIGSKRINA